MKLIQSQIRKRLKELKPEKPEDIEQEIRKIKEQIERTEEEKPIPAADVAPDAKKIQQYQDSYIPDYLRGKKESGSFLNMAMGFFLRNRFEKRGEENLPKEGPFITICNHFGGETGPLLASLGNRDVHVTADKELNWKRSSFRSWLLKKMGMIAVDGSLENLSPQEQEQLIERVPKGSRREGYKRVMQKGKTGGVATNVDFIRQSIALLSRGDVVAVYPEGLFLYENEKKLHKGYQGIEVIARRYKELTGKDISIVPIAIFQQEGQKRKTVSIGEPIKMDDNKTELSGTDWCMEHLAQLLPEEQRGYYSETADETGK